MWEIKGKDNQLKATINSLEYNGEWMGESYVTVTVESPAPVNFEIGDYIIYRDERFEINYDPGKIKSAPRYEKGDAFKYENIKFNSLADELTRCDFRDLVLQDNNLHFTSLPKFPFYGGVRDLANRIQANLDKLYTGANKWAVIVSPEFQGDKELNVQVDNIKVQGALEILVNDLETYYTIKGRTIIIGAAGIPAGHLFKYGKGNGLYEIEQNAEADQAIVTRLRAYGSTRNLPHRYYNSLSGADGKKLIPDNMAVQHLMLPEFPYTTQDPYIDSPNIAKLGVREGTIFFDGSGELEEIYPSIEGMTAEQLKAAGVPCNSTGALDEIVSAEQMTDNGVGEINEGETQTTAKPPTFKVTLKDLGFDINDHKTTETATISFKTGMLGGRDFEIVGCKKIESGGKVTGYELELNRVYDDSIKLWFPYSAYNAQAGDKFVLLYIEMPEVYIKAAAQRLKEAATEWLSKNDYSRSIYAPKVDEIFMARQHDLAMASGGKIKSLHDTLKEGMLLLFEDEDLNIDASIFIDRLAIKEEGAVPTYEVVLKEEKTVGRLDKMQNQIDSLAAGKGQGGGGYTAAQIRSMIEAYGGAYFLSKIKSDAALGRIDFKGGATFGEFSSGRSGAMVSLDGWAEFEDVVGRKTVSAGGKVEVGDFISGATGAAVWIDDEGVSHAEADVVHVRRKISAKEVEIQRESHVGGSVIVSPAAARVSRVTRLAEGDYKLFFDGADAQGRVVRNEFGQYDLVRCLTFNIERQADGFYGNRYYWRECVATGTDHYVWYERTGRRVANLCAEPRPVGVSMTPRGYFLHDDGTGFALTGGIAAGTRVTLRLRGRFAAAGDGGAAIEIYPGGNWDAGLRVGADNYEGGRGNEAVTMSFDWPADCGDAQIIVGTARYTGSGWVADSEATIDTVELVEGTEIEGEPVTEHFIVLSDSSKDASGTCAPAVGDEIHTVGNRHIPARRNVIFLSAYDANAGTAPYLMCYSNVHEFSLATAELTARLSPAGNYIRGEFEVHVGGKGYQSLKEYAEEYADALFKVAESEITAAVTKVTKEYTDAKVEDAVDDFNNVFGGLDKRIDTVVEEQGRLSVRADGIEASVEKVTTTAAGNSTAIGELKVAADEISAKVSASSFATPNLCATPFVDAVPTADGYLKENDRYFTLTEDLMQGEEVTVRLRGRFDPDGVVSIYFGSWSLGVTISRGDDTFTGGIDDEELVATVWLPFPVSPVLDRVLRIQSARRIGTEWVADPSCRLKYIAVVRGGVMPLEYRNEDAIAGTLLPTGIDIRRGKVEVTADNFEVRNNAGETTTLIDENGKLSTRLIDADEITARRVMAGEEGGRRVVIDPAKQAVEIFDSEGRQCTMLDGTSYPQGPSELGIFGGLNGIEIGAVGHGTWRRTNGLLSSSTIITSEAWECPKGTLKFAGDITLAASIKERSTSESGGGVSSDIGAEYAEISAKLVLTVGPKSYNIGEKTLKVAYNGILSGAGTYPAKSATEAVGISHDPIEITEAGQARLTLTLENSSQCTAEKYEVLAERSLALSEMADQYISRYFANGMMLGSTSSRYFAVWHSSDGYMNAEVRNDNAGVRLTRDGVQMLSAGSYWHRVPLLLAHLYIEPQTDGSVTVSAAKLSNLPTPTATAIGGDITLRFPDWGALGLTASSLAPVITPAAKGATAALTGWTASSLTISTAIDGTARAARFFIDIYRL